MEAHAQDIKNRALQRYMAGDKIADIETELGVTRPTIYKWLKDAGTQPTRRNKTAPLHVRELIDQIAFANQTVGRLKAELEAARSEIVRLLGEQ